MVKGTVYTPSRDRDGIWVGDGQILVFVYSDIIAQASNGKV
jgi:hypothetical protein